MHVGLEVVANKQDLAWFEAELPADQPINLGLWLHQADLEGQDERIRSLRQTADQSTSIRHGEV